MKVPIGVFGMAAGVAAYPTLSRLVATNRVAEAYGLVCSAVRLMLFVTFAAQVCMTLAGVEAVYLVWGLFSNRFSVADAQATGTVLAFLCLGLGGWASQTVISRGFYAFGSTWLPRGAIGLAIASSVAIFIYVLLLGWLQYRRFEREAAARDTNLKAVPGMLGAALGLAVATGLAIGAGLYLRYSLLQFLPGMQILAILLRATVLCAFGIAIYLIVARLLGVTELASLQRLLSRRLMRSR
jgi:putative peptidoglycan lipid II flippase